MTYCWMQMRPAAATSSGHLLRYPRERGRFSSRLYRNGEYGHLEEGHFLHSMDGRIICPCAKQHHDTRGRIRHTYREICRRRVSRSATIWAR